VQPQVWLELEQVQPLLAWVVVAAVVTNSFCSVRPPAHSWPTMLLVQILWWRVS
jgi:hypothetical protein